MRRMYSENQIKNIVQQADWSGVDLKVNKIEQKVANWAFDIEEFPGATDCTSEVIFCRIQQINQELHIVMLGKIHNPTESDKTIYSTGGINVTLPEAISSKIYSVLGNPLSEETTQCRISVNYASIFKNDTITANLENINADAIMAVQASGDVNKMYINFGARSGIVLKAGKDTYFESRVSLDLI